MAQKPEIQYVGQFYIHGSEAKKLARKNEQKKARTELPVTRVERVRKVYVDPLAICSLMMAAVLMVSMVAGMLSLQTAWNELDIAQQYVYELETQNSILAAQYHSGYDLKEVERTALALGMTPRDQVPQLVVHIPAEELPAEPSRITLLTRISTLISGLLA